MLPQLTHFDQRLELHLQIEFTWLNIIHNGNISLLFLADSNTIIPTTKTTLRNNNYNYTGRLCLDEHVFQCRVFPGTLFNAVTITLKGSEPFKGKNFGGILL
jgi:hypothetical protein